MFEKQKLVSICKTLRYYILASTTKAGSGHPSSSLSAVELMATLFFAGILKQNLDHFRQNNNDRIIFSKGHASPLFYSLYTVLGKITEEELLTLRQFNSNLEGHPTMRFEYTESATGSLGQGLSIGIGLALSSRFKKVYVLLGDSEFSEGQIYEALQIAAYYKLNNLIGILDVNRLGQRGETMFGWNLLSYQERIASFGWETIIINDGHNLEEIYEAYRHALLEKDKPVMIIAKTIKGKGVPLLENQDGWHGKTLDQEQLVNALISLGEVNKKLEAKIELPEPIFTPTNNEVSGLRFTKDSEYKVGELIATREAYGDALVSLGQETDKIVVLDAETSNSTFADKFKKVFPNRFFEMFIAEQNMISTAVGFSKNKLIPFVSSFAAFLTRSYDQIRMAAYSEANIKIVGSHCGVSIGADGASQMGLEDIGMIKSIFNSLIFYPADAVSAFKLTQILASEKGIGYLRTTREKLPVLYENNEEFVIGGSKIFNEKEENTVLIIAAGITLHEALRAQEKLATSNISVVVVDLYSVKPIDSLTVLRLARRLKKVITVEDHYLANGIGDSVNSVLKNENTKIINLAVNKMARSGKMEELLAYEEIDSDAIIKAVKQLI